MFENFAFIPDWQQLIKAPAYKIMLDGKNITPAFQKAKAISLSIEESRDGMADRLNITIDDTDGLITIPRKGVELNVSIGYQHQPLVEKGSFIIETVEYEGPPDTIILTGYSARFSSNLKRRRTHSWHRKTLGDILKAIADRHQLILKVHDSLASQYIAHIDQTSESDIAFIMRLGERFDAVATIKVGRLIFLKVNDSSTASGQELPIIPITLTDTTRIRYSEGDSESYTGVKAYYYDTDDAEQKHVIVGTDDNPKELSSAYANAKEATDAADSEWQQVQRSVSTISLSLKEGREDFMPQSRVSLIGFKHPLNDPLWLVKTVRHSIDGSGFMTSLELEKYIGKDPTTNNTQA